MAFSSKVIVTAAILLFGQAFGDFNGINDDYFDNGFDYNGNFIESNMRDDSFPDQGGILGDSIMNGDVITGGIAGSRGGMDYIPPPQPRFDRRGRGGLLGGSFNPMGARPMVLPKRMPMVRPSIGGGLGGFPRFQKMSRVGGGILGMRRPSFRRSRMSSTIGRFGSRGYRKNFRFGRMGRGGIGGLSRRRFKTY